MELADHIVRFAFQSGCDFIVAPALLYLGFDLIERAFARRRNGGDVIPNIAALGIDRIVVDANIGGKSGLDNIGTAGNVDGRLTIQIAS